MSWSEIDDNEVQHRTLGVIFKILHSHVAWKESAGQSGKLLDKLIILNQFMKEEWIGLTDDEQATLKRS